MDRLLVASKRSKSDIDLRIVGGGSMTFGMLYELTLELEEALVRKVDFVTNPPEHMRPAFRKSIEKDEVRLYEVLWQAESLVCSGVISKSVFCRILPDLESL